jgi:hypothetical protein
VREAIIHVYLAGGLDALSRTEGRPMSTIDKQRIAAVRKLEQLGYTFAAGDWMHPANDAAPAPASQTSGLPASWPKNEGALQLFLVTSWIATSEGRASEARRY